MREAAARQLVHHVEQGTGQQITGQAGLEHHADQDADHYLGAVRVGDLSGIGEAGHRFGESVIRGTELRHAEPTGPRRVTRARRVTALAGLRGLASATLGTHPTRACHSRR